ncbi:hypothetical protein EV201_3368 [Ancylomarina subtilis]|uniref:Uncharacterized protein n=1 Tax=Ancylomarina subtilis TaxID=1639035 RepID=A0A4Q7V8U8_9BACT|nr:hypothetical protein [Ancylomarina subtilis]RZT91028.1 hypothetical protein EV201_3368 [Ancylomarina subtilis]
MNLIELFKSIGTFFYSSKESELRDFSEEEYIQTFVANKKLEELKETYQKAWEAKNFEIENYWKRANYFWAFQVASFAGYFAVLSSKSYEKTPQILFFVVCIGFISALAWVFINIGSKTWQRHWENHVDMLEDKVTGPLYKIVTANKTYSVSKINDIVSRFFAVIWIILGIQYFANHLTFKWSGITNVDYLILLSSIATIYFAGAMIFGHGRGRFGSRDVKFYKRKPQD